MIEVFHGLEQGTDAWRQARCGLVTASCFSDVLANGRGGAESKTRKSYMRRLAAEVITGQPLESFTNGALERGKIMEVEARDYYAFLAGVEPELVGFIRSGQKGCSPDALIGSDGLLELKTQRPDLLIETLEKAGADKSWFPPEHVAQCQGALWIAEREWIDICVYFTGMPSLIRRAYRDEIYIAKLAKAIDEFNSELAEMVESVRRYSQRAAA